MFTEINSSATNHLNSDIRNGVLSIKTGNATVSTDSARKSGVLPQLLKYVLIDILKNKMVLFYTIFLFGVSFGLMTMSGDPVKGMASLLNILLLVTPMLSIIFSTTYFYNAYEFTELLAAQPVKRSIILLSQYLGLSIALLLSLAIGAGIPLMMFAPGIAGWTLLAVTAALTLVFVSMAFLSALLSRDKARGIGLSLLLWFYFTLLYDALMLMVMFAFIDYPLEQFTLVMVALNPIDLARTIVLLQLDVSALMGYTGALMQEILGQNTGIIAATGILILWAALPLFIAVRRFNRRDF